LRHSVYSRGRLVVLNLVVHYNYYVDYTIDIEFSQCGKYEITKSENHMQHMSNCRRHDDMDMCR